VKIDITDWHGVTDLPRTVCLGYHAPTDAVVTYWGTRPADVQHVLTLPSRAIDPRTLAEWCSDQAALIGDAAMEPDPLIAADLRTLLAFALHDAQRNGVVRRLWPASVGLARVPDDARKTPAEQAAEILRVEGYDVSPAAIGRERAKQEVPARSVLRK
jgi:hypothetical protein